MALPRVIGTLAGVPPLLRHHSDLLRQGRAPRRARLHDGQRRRPRPLAPADRRRRLLPHRHRRARPEGGPGGRGAGDGARRPGPTSSPRGSPRPGPASTSPTTTSSAPPSPATTEAVQQFLRRIYDNGYIYKDLYRGLVLRAVRAVLRRDELVDGDSVPDPPPPGRVARGGELLLPAQRLRASGSSTGTRPTPTPSSPSRSATRRSASSRAACATSRSPAPRSTGASRSRGTRSTSSTSGTTRSINYLTAIGYGDDERAVRRRGGRPSTT